MAVMAVFRLLLVAFLLVATSNCVLACVATAPGSSPAAPSCHHHPSEQEKSQPPCAHQIVGTLHAEQAVVLLASTATPLRVDLAVAVMAPAVSTDAPLSPDPHLFAVLRI